MHWRTHKLRIITSTIVPLTDTKLTIEYAEQYQLMEHLFPLWVHIKMLSNNELDKTYKCK